VFSIQTGILAVAILNMRLYDLYYLHLINPDRKVPCFTHFAVIYNLFLENIWGYADTGIYRKEYCWHTFCNGCSRHDGTVANDIENDNTACPVGGLLTKKYEKDRQDNEISNL
jgi:hypothetical protein